MQERKDSDTEKENWANPEEKSKRDQQKSDPQITELKGFFDGDEEIEPKTAEDNIDYDKDKKAN
ncbi:MAG: hypothetical protein ABI266_06845 [Ginsengibacter sp.]